MNKTDDRKWDTKLGGFFDRFLDLKETAQVQENQQTVYNVNPIIRVQLGVSNEKILKGDKVKKWVKEQFSPGV